MAIPKPTRKSRKQISQRDLVKKRDRGRCQFPKCGRETNTLHHVIFRSHGGKNDEANLVTLCADHHTGNEGPHQKDYWRRFWENWAAERYPAYWANVRKGIEN